MKTAIGQSKYCIPKHYSRCLISLCSSLSDFNSIFEKKYLNGCNTNIYISSRSPYPNSTKFALFLNKIKLREVKNTDRTVGQSEQTEQLHEPIRPRAREGTYCFDVADSQTFGSLPCLQPRRACTSSCIMG